MRCWQIEHALAAAPPEPAEMLADSTPKSLFLGLLQSGVVTKNKDLRSLARFIVLAFQQSPLGRG